MAKKVVRILHLGIYQPEADIIEIMEKKGYMVSEVMRSLIRRWGDEKYPREKAYARAQLIRAEISQKKVEEKKEFDAMSPEEYTVRVLRGKVKGNKAVFRIASGQEIGFNLATIKQYTTENNEVVAIHNQLLDKTFTYVGDKEPDEEQYAVIWKGW